MTTGMYQIDNGRGGSIGTTHFSPYSYGRHVPLAFFGSAFEPGIYHDRVAPVDLASTLASLLGINQPSAAVGRVLTMALKPESGTPAQTSDTSTSRMR
jgi:arylsulfatase A-like enzyme